MESWADDRPVNWNEKIVFSDEEKNREIDWADDTGKSSRPNRPRSPELDREQHRRRNYDDRIKFKNFIKFLFYSIYDKYWW